jgi:hypothetical protein
MSTPALILYGHFYSSCIFESAPNLESLHSTKAGAYRAMRRAHVARFDQDRALWLELGRRCGGRRGEKSNQHTARFVAPVAVVD